MIKIISAIGLHTIQDSGRSGYRAYGIPVSGPMDDFASETANLLVNNSQNAGVIEISTGQISISFDNEYLISVTGFAIAFLNGGKIATWKAVRISDGDILDVQTHPMGNFACLSIAGGWANELWLGSSSAYLPLEIGKSLQKGDILNVNDIKSELAQIFLSHLKSTGKRTESWGLGPSVFPDYLSDKIRIIEGPEKDFFTSGSIEDFLNHDFEISNEMNRMAILVKDTPLVRATTREMLSVAVQKGTIQVTPDFTMYILMSDAQTTGGYPRIGQIAAVDLPVFAQMRSSRKFRFEWISIQEARQLLHQRIQLLQQLQVTLEKKYLSYLH